MKRNQKGGKIVDDFLHRQEFKFVERTKGRRKENSQNAIKSVQQYSKKKSHNQFQMIKLRKYKAVMPSCYFSQRKCKQKLSQPSFPLIFIIL